MLASGGSSVERPGIHNQAEVAYQRLRERLVRGHYSPGDRLTEVGLCEDLGMSRTPVREALRRLQSDGLVSATGRGVVVSALTLQEMQHAMQLQEALDSLAARLTATAQREGRLSPAQLNELKAAAHAVEERAETGDVTGAWRANLDFHMMLAHLSGNPLLADALGRIWARFAVGSHANIHRRHDLTPREHEAIVSAILDGDPDRAEAAAAEHVRAAAAMYGQDHPGH
ncbi:GntR family transcriptional regulator [Streptomyces sp. NBC_00878]|uniref:GntR family transcriptional regulator n=1 Tax=Streptomyces sp. NBC_00878 TaxID=2975854 RepID=UPI00225AB48B|nr:GntR family transcriptional regulator [Streptomyces sp. NBC_00878]MCX4911690.1 GntR family transcriptional regulator [Streptomyces sp. NBC_00878]